MSVTRLATAMMIQLASPFISYRAAVSHWKLHMRATVDCQDAEAYMTQHKSWCCQI